MLSLLLAGQVVEKHVELLVIWDTLTKACIRDMSIGIGSEPQQNATKHQQCEYCLNITKYTFKPKPSLLQNNHFSCVILNKDIMLMVRHMGVHRWLMNVNLTHILNISFPAKFSELVMPGPSLNTKSVIPGVGILIIETRRPWPSYIYNGNPIVVRRYLYIGTAIRIFGDPYQV